MIDVCVLEEVISGETLLIVSPHFEANSTTVAEETSLFSFETNGLRAQTRRDDISGRVHTSSYIYIVVYVVTTRGLDAMFIHIELCPAAIKARDAHEDDEVIGKVTQPEPVDAYETET